MEDKFDTDPNKCQCRDWTYDHHRDLIWPFVETPDGEMPILGHHPGCMYWIKPPHPDVAGVSLDGHAKMALALVALARAYSNLYWSVNPPKDPDAES